jgi:hypothetical protein
MKFDVSTSKHRFMAVLAAGLIITGCTTAGEVSCLYRNVESQGPFMNSPQDSMSINKAFKKNEPKLESQCDPFLLGNGNKLYLLIQAVSSTPLYPVVYSKNWSSDELYDLLRKRQLLDKVPNPTTPFAGISWLKDGAEPSGIKKD